MSDPTRALADLVDTDLGTHTASYDEAAAILYALAVGAPEDRLDLVYERDLRVLPTYACALGLWAVEAAGRLGAYDPTRSLHAAQRLVVHRPMPSSGQIEMRGRVAAVLDKGKAALVQVEVTSREFSATYDIFLPGLGGFGGERGPSSSAAEPVEMNHSDHYATSRGLAVLYRLTGDRHPVHIDPEVAAANGFARPILHGLCTLGIATRILAGQTGAHPADLTELSVRLTAPVLPGDEIEVRSGVRDGVVRFEAKVGETAVLRAGTARFSGTR
ncbi:MAG: enoyl-CoA hydratase [Intrasporangium sp.]|uniref:MaoC/PaaZ C-terminal domain-containing protein n=1 Tax=Intrasporangium sp. TaxID=1925024 RepID=UPI00264755F8|nr:MaoC/PaaZ C-terminal domain-containing protein [Intrasporangium sp.]MDN5794121.1 enoyl-CoA hydratase [Intrasporangium sp.]